MLEEKNIVFSWDSIECLKWRIFIIQRRNIVSKGPSRIIEEGIENVEKPKSSSRISVVEIASTQSSNPRENFFYIYFINLIAPQLKGIKMISVEGKMKSVKKIRLKI